MLAPVTGRSQALFGKTDLVSLFADDFVGIEQDAPVIYPCFGPLKTADANSLPREKALSASAKRSAEIGRRR